MYFLCELKEEGVLKCTCTDENNSDLFTKNLAGQGYAKHSVGYVNHNWKGILEV